jgi:amino acid transporter
MGSLVLNASLAFLMCVTLVFRMGDVDSILSTTTGYPFIQVFYNATQSYAGTNVMVAIVIVLLTVCCISEVATASRQIWSFARDRGLPGSSWLSKVELRHCERRATTDRFRSLLAGIFHYPPSSFPLLSAPFYHASISDLLLR